MRYYSFTDRILIEGQHALAAILGGPHDASLTTNPAGVEQDLPDFSEPQRTRSQRLMRVNHAGEISAQALYRGQALSARNPLIKDHMERAAREEGDHLVWCEQRLTELNSRRSLLNPLWYTGSWAIGVAAGLAGDRWNLGFLEETERQVVRHLDHHLRQLPSADRRSHAILSQMQRDEARHACEAARAGAEPLPWPVQRLMQATSSLMTRTAYWF